MCEGRTSGINHHEKLMITTRVLIFWRKIGRQDCDMIAFNFRLQKQAVTSLDKFIEKKKKTFVNNSMQSGIGCMVVFLRHSGHGSDEANRCASFTNALHSHSFFPLTTTEPFKFSLSFQNFNQKIMTSEAVEEALSQLSNEQIEQFRKYFNMFDKEKKGYIHTSQVGQILRTMGQAFEDRDLKQLIKEFDTDGSGEIEFEEFAALVARFVMQEDDSANMEEELREAFRLYDKEGNGYINVSDLRDILRALDENITEDELDEMIAEIDTDGSGTVDFDEFMEMMSGGD
ncbi:Troponin C, isoform 2 [Trichinella patagoniensis]|uniref:Troponin C, isoform 2 n=2 Tax=Trichinella TaxID=6333 RepID=A0A0V0ZP15_9BILA|nr:Troponin C, isoform 2 [Trichinella patagoniensis]